MKISKTEKKATKIAPTKAQIAKAEAFQRFTKREWLIWQGIIIPASVKRAAAA